MRSLTLLLLLALPLLAAWGTPHPLHVPRSHGKSVVVPILEYHRVGSVAGLPGLTVAPGQFAAEMDWLHRAGYHAITPTRLLGALDVGVPLPPRPVMITFDDGYRDVLWNAAPLLHRLHMPATAFVITDRVGGRDPSFLDWPELARLEALGFAVGSHTVHHAVLTALSDEQAYAELHASRLELEHRLGVPIWSIAYPMGRVDPRIEQIARAAGYVLGFTELPGTAQRVPLLLRRYEILPTTGVAGVRALVESAQP